MKQSKAYQAIKKEISEEKLGLSEAIDFIKSHPAAKFDETIEIHISLGVDTSKSEQMVRGSVNLPAGTPKAKRVAVFTEDMEAAKAATAAGAVIVGGADLISQIESEGKLDADVAVADPKMMAQIAKVAKILGPKGLMPNPKTGTVTPNVAQAVEDLAGGKISFKMDQHGNIHEGIGKQSWEADKTVDNAKAFIEAVKTSRPATSKGQFLKSITIASTMGPGVSVELN